MRSTRVQSPVSPSPFTYKLSFSDLAQYVNHSDRQASLRSTSQTSSIADSTQEAIAEAAAAATQWENERQTTKSYHRCEFDSSWKKTTSLRQKTPNGDEETSSESQTALHPSFCLSASAARPQFDGYDGAADESTMENLPQPMRRESWPRAAKRKTSQFSLRSIVTPFAKKVRRDVKNFASNAYRGSGRQFSRVCELMKQQRDEERRQYAAWKAFRRRNKPGDAIKGKIRKGFGTFSIERSRYGHEMWWKKGVEKYRAPEWMKFDAAS